MLSVVGLLSTDPPASPQELAAKFSNAYVYASWVIDGTVLIGVIEGVTAALLLMRLRRGKPAHWFARPLAWALLIVGSSVVGATINVQWLQSLLSDHQTRSIWGVPTELAPSVVGVPVVLGWIVYGVDVARRALGRRRRETKRTSQQRTRAPSDAAKARISRLCVASGVIVMVADFTWIAYMIHELARPAGVAGSLRFVLFGAVGALVAALFAVQFLWSGKSAWEQRRG